MKLYFLSSRPAALYVGGAYFGTVGDFEKFASVPLQDKLLATFMPEGALPVSFFLDETLRFSPPEGVEIYLLKDGAAIFVKDYPPADFSLKLCAQARQGDCLATLFCQGNLTLCVEKGEQVCFCKLPQEFAQAQIGFWGETVFVTTKSRLAIVSLLGELLLKTDYLLAEYENGEIFLTCPLFDSQNRAARQVFSFQNGRLCRTQYSLLLSNDEQNRGQVVDAYLSYTFFESVLLGGDFGQLLSDELQQKASSIKDFLGDFKGVCFTQNPLETGLIFPIQERVFEVRYARVQITSGKICDVSF
jgi:hypothetical protein